MPNCPQCNKAFVQLPRKCPTCQTELDLLVEYTNQLQVGLEQAEQMTRAGELGKAMWGYLAVLEIDPDNPIARRQVGQIATAVRQFDRTAPGQRWLLKIRADHAAEEAGRFRWLWRGVAIVGVLLAFATGYLAGYYTPVEYETEPPKKAPPPPGVNKPKDARSVQGNSAPAPGPFQYAAWPNHPWSPRKQG